ncbi:MAG: DUF6290 family protein [Schleiferilactobacillus harbinensis]
MAHMTSVHFDDRTDALLDAFTQSHGVSRSTFIQEAVAEKLGGWVDTQAADEAYQKWQADNYQTKSLTQIAKDLGLDAD